MLKHYPKLNLSSQIFGRIGHIVYMFPKIRAQDQLYVIINVNKDLFKLTYIFRRTLKHFVKTVIQDIRI